MIYCFTLKIIVLGIRPRSSLTAKGVREEGRSRRRETKKKKENCDNKTSAYQHPSLYFSFVLDLSWLGASIARSVCLSVCLSVGWSVFKIIFVLFMSWSGIPAGSKLTVLNEEKGPAMPELSS